MPKNNLPTSRIIVIIGPNASGKSDLALRLAKLAQGKLFKRAGINGAEIISADSRQVYKGMDIGTGKITKKEMRGVPHHLLDVVSPKMEFNVSRFKKLATKKIEEIVGRDRVPIIVGGTGFWIDALIYAWPIPDVEPNRALRGRLEKLRPARLFAKLQKLDPARAAAIKTHNEVNNKRRLIRALEIILVSGKPSPESPLVYKHARSVIQVAKIEGKEYKILILGIKLPQKELEKRIYKRLTKRLKRGMLVEIKKLHDSGVSWKRLDNFGLEYRYVSRYLHGLLSYDSMVEALYSSICKYAKRQMTWFKRNPNIYWVGSLSKVPNLVKKFID